MITELLSLQNQIKIWHWQTEKYPLHMATDRTHDALLSQIDKFVEVFSGKYGHINAKEYTIVLKGLTSDEGILEYVDGKIEYLIKDLPKILNEVDTDLFNLRDEILATLNQFKYLLSLK